MSGPEPSQASTSPVPAPSAGELRDDALDVGAPWYQRDWARVVAGLLVISAVVLLTGEAVMHALGAHPTDPIVHRAYDTRAIAAVIVTATWVGWRAHRAERKLWTARERARQDEAALAEERWRTEQAEGLAALSRVLAHELKNPLHVIHLHGTVIERAAEHLPGPEGERIRAAAGVLDERSARMRELLDEYLAYGKGTELRLAAHPVSLQGVAADAVEAWRQALDDRGIAVRLLLHGAAPAVRGDEGRLAQCVHHLLQRAVDVLPRGSHVEVAVWPEGGQVLLSVTDDGPAFPDPEAVFRPFFTGSPRAGLGFAVLRDIVRAHRGEVAARNVGERGARVEIRLPAGERA